MSVYNEYSIPDAPVVPLLSSAWLCLTPHCARCSSKCSPNYFKFFGECHGAELRWLRHAVESRAQPQQCTRIRSLDNCSVRCARVVVCALAFEVKHGLHGPCSPDCSATSMLSVSILLLIVLIVCWYVINNVLCEMVESLDVSVALNRV